jgi:hypothetical protein
MAANTTFNDGSSPCGAVVVGIARPR